MEEVVLEFEVHGQSATALRAAAYRLIGQGSTLIDSRGGMHVCRLQPAPGQDAAGLRARFLDLVTDENLREQIATSTEGTRNIILALAFGAIARAEDQGV